LLRYGNNKVDIRKKMGYRGSKIPLICRLCVKEQRADAFSILLLIL